jgi:hypothetical protein
MRREDRCLNCGRVIEIAAHGLCFACYRRAERADDNRFKYVDRHNPGLNKEHKKIFRGFASVMGGLSDLGVSRSNVLTIRRVIEPYLVPIANFLTVAPENDEAGDAVNSEQKSADLFTVHSLIRSDAKTGEQ